MVDKKKHTKQVLFWGMMGDFSYLVLEELLLSGVNVCGIVVPAVIQSQNMSPIIRLKPAPSNISLPMSQPFLNRSLNHLAWQNEIPA